MSMEFKKFQNKILVHMKTFDKSYIRVLDHFLGREKHLSFFFRTVFMYDNFSELQDPQDLFDLNYCL